MAFRVTSLGVGVIKFFSFDAELINNNVDKVKLMMFFGQ